MLWMVLWLLEVTWVQSYLLSRYQSSPPPPPPPRGVGAPPPLILPVYSPVPPLTIFVGILDAAERWSLRLTWKEQVGQVPPPPPPPPPPFPSATTPLTRLSMFFLDRLVQSSLSKTKPMLWEFPDSSRSWT